MKRQWQAAGLRVRGVLQEPDAAEAQQLQQEPVAV
jgi:hypothetical protein